MPSKPSANNTIRWGILGTANIAIKRFIPGVRASGNGTVAAIASREQARADEIARTLEIPNAYGTYEALLADDTIDAIYICVPNALHAQWTLAAARAGKPVLCEKPLARDAEEAARVVDACARANVPLMEAFMYRFHPQHARVRELIADGTIGELRAVRASFMFFLDPLGSANVRLSGELAGGALMDVGCYTVNAARMLFAEEPLWASAQWDFHDDRGIDVALSGILGFSDNRMATLDCSFRAAGKSNYQVVGTRGRIDVLDAFTPDPTRPCELTITDAAGKRRTESIPGVDQYALEAQAFAASLCHPERSAQRVVEGRTTPDMPLPPSDAIANMRAIDALKTSARNDGRRQPL